MAGPGSNQSVLLIHGLWMVGAVMEILGYRLRQAGFRTQNFSYRMISRGLDENIERLHRRIGEMSCACLHLVGHSLGGVLALQTLHRYPDAVSGRVVCLGSPLLDTVAGRRLDESRWGSKILGRTLPEAIFETPLGSWQGRQSVGVIAGTLGAGLGMLVTRRLNRPHDGVVEVAETRLSGIADHIELPANHLGMLLSRPTADQTARFLRHGRFDRN